MNGIFAWAESAPPVDLAELERSRDWMAARGPDGKGSWLSDDRRTGFGHRRLSIIDLSNGGAQPMALADGSLVVTFNGEIYNYRELREELEAGGAVFRGASDTEVLLHLYARRGEAMVHDLRGMFAFAIWDARERQVFLARDPYGIKPLYYSLADGVLRFASQVRALLAGGAVSREQDSAALAGFYLWGAIPEPFTICRGISALPAGCSMIVNRDGPRAPVRYHKIAQVYCDAEARTRPADAAATIRAALLDSVRHHLVADVPVGAFLSAGIDSGALVGLMRDAGKDDIQTVTLSFEEFQGRHDDEGPLAAVVARSYGARHTNRVVTRAEFLANLPRILEAMDQPSIDGINTYFVSKAARELGLKVVVSGVGGDELFGGYPAFTDIPRWVRWLSPLARAPFLGRAFRRLGTAVGADRMGLNPKGLALAEYGGDFAGAYFVRRGLYMPWELGRIMDPELAREGLERLDLIGGVEAELSPRPASDFAKIATLESSLYMRNQLLRDADWASMAHSLELRTPLVDSTLLACVAGLGRPDNAGGAKGWLAAAPSKPLPDEVTKREKTGFGVPTGRWIQELIARTGDSTSSQSRDWARYVHARWAGV